jgi:type III restriction enzyme
VFETTKSHVNRVVADTDRWEQIAARTLEKLTAVESYVKNAFLGCEVPYVDAAGIERRYLPDFIVRVRTESGARFHLIVEVTGFARDKAEKRYFMRERWLPAVMRIWHNSRVCLGTSSKSATSIGSRNNWKRRSMHWLLPRMQLPSAAG